MLVEQVRQAAKPRKRSRWPEVDKRSDGAEMGAGTRLVLPEHLVESLIAIEATKKGTSMPFQRARLIVVSGYCRCCSVIGPSKKIESHQRRQGAEVSSRHIIQLFFVCERPHNTLYKCSILFRGDLNFEYHRLRILAQSGVAI